MSHKTKQLSAIDNHTKYSVYGYIKSQHKSLFKSSPYALFQNVPIAISSLCTLYYHIEDNLVGSKGSIPNLVTISEDGKTIKKRNDPWQIRFAMPLYHYDNDNHGSLIIPSTNKGIYTWSIKMVYLPLMRYSIVIGIKSDGYQLATRKHLNYSYFIRYPAGNGSLESHDSKFGRFYGANDIFITGDVIKMELNLKNRQIEYYKNDECLGVAFDFIDVGEGIDYRLYVCVASNNTQLCINQCTEHF